MPETEVPIHEIITEGGLHCTNCGEWRNLATIRNNPCMILTCRNCGDEAFDLLVSADEHKLTSGRIRKRQPGSERKARLRRAGRRHWICSKRN